MTDLKGSETEKNLLNTFAGESKVRNKYTFYSMIAKKEGYDYISKIFDEIANNEKEHAKICFRLLNNGEFPHTMENLEDAAKVNCLNVQSYILNMLKSQRRRVWTYCRYI